MKLSGSRILITGAGGGIGRALVAELLAQGADVLLTGRTAATLQNALDAAGASPERASFVVADITDALERERLCELARQWHGGIDVLINNAGISPFGLLQDASPGAAEQSFLTNVIAPIELCRSLLPHLKQQGAAQIVNIGSALGSIGLAGNTIYCATKFGLRGFSEALRRELGDTNVDVRHFAPRATRTAINSPAAIATNEALGIAMDDPADVARQIVALMQSRRRTAVLGWPEKVFARINALWPSLVDRAVASQLPIVNREARAKARSRSVATSNSWRKAV